MKLVVVVVLVWAVFVDLTVRDFFTHLVSLCLIMSINQVKQGITLSAALVYCQGAVGGDQGNYLVVDQTSKSMLVMTSVVSSRSLGNGHSHKGTQGKGNFHDDDECVVLDP